MAARAHVLEPGLSPFPKPWKRPMRAAALPIL